MFGNRIMLSSALVMVLCLTLAAPTFADSPRSLDGQLSDFQQRAYKVRVQADVLQSFLNNRLSWESHSAQLSELRHHVNQLGKSLVELQAQKGMATAGQAMAIEHAGPHLASVAERLTRALELVREDRNNIRWQEYAEVVDGMHDHARDLHNKIDTILDYENAKVRLDKLELQPAST